MKSPFPGLDPYLEPFWPDVHTRLTVALSDQIQNQLPPGLRARIQENVNITLDDEEPKRYEPDIFVDEKKGLTPGNGGVATLEPPIELTKPLVLEIPPPTKRHIEIVDTQRGNQLITAIEILSRANKTGETGRAAYRQKQHAFLGSTQVSLVEIDLIRKGAYVLAAEKMDVPEVWQNKPLICVYRAWRRCYELYPAMVHETLPNFTVPLREFDGDAVIELQKALEECYAAGRYGEDIDYAVPPEPRFDETEAEWAEENL